MTIPHHVIRSKAVRKPIRIMHITDVHFSPVQGESMARQIEDVYHRYKPDIILSTGDLLDRGIKDRKQVVRILSSLNPPLGKFGCTGNHEFISDIKYSEKFHRETGFTLLRNEVVNLKGISIAGVDDPLGVRLKRTNGKSELDVVKQMSALKYRILLKHQPRFETSNAFHLQLSGHTHGGQFFPFTLFTRLIFKYNLGKYFVQGSTIIVGAGTGTWGPYMRVGIPPEIIIIDLLPEKEAPK
ncbi:metallophosphoesterase [Myxococcota bacterium]|nr:metallophosphoesterase [Myxococcota bacterium]MBU1379506.1 metallophosphoesterase [Myxococcota bacterium]MBU1495729.1 metallophosphoesterase [Myxococcota bacterium]